MDKDKHDSYLTKKVIEREIVRYKDKSIELEIERRKFYKKKKVKIVVSFCINSYRWTAKC